MGIVRITQGAAWEQGVLDNVVAAEHGLTLPGPVVEYERDSLAYHPETGEEIPADTPIFVKFAEGRLGSLMCEGVTNLLTENRSSFETSAQFSGITQFTPEQSDDWSYHGNYSAKLVKASDSWANFFQNSSLSSVDVGTMFSISCYVFVPPGSNYIGKTVRARVRFAGGAQPTSFLSVTNYVLRQGVQRLTASAPLDYADRTSVGISVIEGEMQPEGSYFYVDGLQIEQKPYSTPWHPGGSTRADPLKTVTLPQALPSEFGIGIAFKLLHGYNQEGIEIAGMGYLTVVDPSYSRNVLDVYRRNSGNNQLSLWLSDSGSTSFVRNLSAGNYQAGDIIRFYVHRSGDSWTFYVRGADGEIRSATNIASYDKNLSLIRIGVNRNGRAANAILADFVLHTRPADIDPIGYLSAVPGGGGE